MKLDETVATPVATVSSRRAAEGDERFAAVEREPGDLYRRLAPAVLGYLRAERAAEPEDLLHDVFLQVARDLPRFDGPDEKLRPWVFSIAHNRLIDSRRRARVRPVKADSPPPDVGFWERRMAGPDQDLIDACRQLTDDQREVVVLRFVGDLSLEDVALVTGRSVTAVKRLQARGLGKLADLLER